VATSHLLSRRWKSRCCNSVLYPWQTTSSLCWLAHVTPPETTLFSRQERATRPLTFSPIWQARLNWLSRGRYVCRPVNHVILGQEIFRQNTSISVHNFMCKIFRDSIAKRAMHTFHDRTLQDVFLHIWNWMPHSSCNMSWKCLFGNSLPLSVRNHIGRRLVEYLGSVNIDRNAEAKEGPLFVSKGIISRYFGSTSSTERMYL